MYNGNTYDSNGLIMLTDREILLMRIAFSNGYETGHDAVYEKKYRHLKGDEISTLWIEESVEDGHLEEEIERLIKNN